MPTRSMLPGLGEPLLLTWGWTLTPLSACYVAPARKPPTRAEDKLRLQAAGRRKLEEFRARRAATCKPGAFPAGAVPAAPDSTFTPKVPVMVAQKQPLEYLC